MNRETTGAEHAPGRPARRRRRWPWLLVAGIAVAALGVTLAGGLSPDGTASEADVTGPPTEFRDDPAPALTGRTLAGEPFDLAELRGEVVVVNMMASWCAPCREELPLLARTAKRWSSDGLRVVGVAMRDKDEQIRALLDETGASDLPVITDPTGSRAVSWGVAGVPETYVVGRDGRLLLHAIGPLTETWIDRHLVPLVGG
ncbi:TlpA family protein disulfide reductase [Actinophytocola glycyrrhizae]|uniref:TlpA family protein disulfide reductase n=1 Tax=Actinophytocola glycyrrhizae TaxID=2044873 RepID=A0ABV9SF43_9PSEU